ncbi:MAG: hypothetical protein ACRDFS_10630 [Chloroflexota bacterium]
MNAPPQTAVPSLSIRPGMDVYSAYQDQYIGSVVRVWRSEATGDDKLTGNELGYAHHDAGSKVPGEELGPFPTARAGNTGPQQQSPRNDFATEPPGKPGVVLFAVRPGRVNLGPLTPSIYVPSSAVRSISMERIVLDVERNQIPDAWHRQPAVAAT